MSSSSPEPRTHEPVLLNEVLALLKPAPGQVVIDATLGSGGHAMALLKQIGPKGRLVGLDQDPEALERAQKTLRPYLNADYFQTHFSQIPEVLEHLNLNVVDAVLLDVGLSTDQLEAAERGFSFLKEGPLDMRMNPENPVTARDLINDLSEKELETLFWEYGEERWSRRIARAIVRERQKQAVETTGALVKIIEKAIPTPARFGPRHPALRIFQALRIRVNGELDALEETLPKAFDALKAGGRLAVISFHSLEDRIVKQTFRRWAEEKKAKILTPKPVQASPEEIQKNPRSRSAKLRAVERTEVS